MRSLNDRVYAYIAAHNLIGSGAPVIVAVSGGPDSLCLLHVLAALRQRLGIELHVAHLDHMIRGAESAAEADFVAKLARHWELPASLEAADVPALARERGNLHAAARDARYAFLARVARSIGAQAVAVAHQAEDQAETVLMHLLRGAGPEGLRGMRPAVPWEEWAPGKESDTVPLSPCRLVWPALIRPLLETTRAEIEAYCAEHALDPRRDPTNRDLDAFRNRVRHDLLPRLIDYNPRIVAALGRTAAICADERAIVSAALDETWPRLARERAGGVDFDGTVWRELPPALQREAIRRAYRRLDASATLELEHVERARALVGRGVGRRGELPGGVALTVGYAGAFALGAPPAPDGPQLPFESAELPSEGRLRLAAAWSIEVARGEGRSPADRWEIALDRKTLDGPLLVRRRRPGDRIRLSAAAGSRSLQDLFVDPKVPRALRAAWPIVATPAAIVWVAGLRAAEGFAAEDQGGDVTKIRLVRDT